MYFEGPFNMNYYITVQNALHKAQTVWTKCNNSKCILHKFIVNQSYLIGGFFIVIFNIVLQKVLLV